MVPAGTVVNPVLPADRQAIFGCRPPASAPARAPNPAADESNMVEYAVMVVADPAKRYPDTAPKRVQWDMMTVCVFVPRLINCGGTDGPASPRRTMQLTSVRLTAPAVAVL